MRFRFTSFLKVITFSLLVSPLLMAGGMQSSTEKTATKVSQSQTQTININKAKASDLEALPGIGPALAARIVAYRQENGPFKKVDSLTKVKGIGPKMLEKLRSRITL